MTKKSTLLAKGIAIAVLLFGHAALRGHINFPLGNYSGAFAVSIFLVFSAIGLSYKYAHNISLDFFRTRYKKIYKPYLIFAPLAMALAIGLKGNLSLKSTLLYLFGLDFTRTIDPTMWFVTYISITYLLFFIVWKIKMRDEIKILLFWVFGLLLFTIKAPPLFSSLSWQFKLHSFGFPLGLTLYYLFLKNRRSIAIESLFGIASLVIFFLSASKIANFNSYVVACLSFATTSFFIIKITNEHRGWLRSVFEDLGKYSYEIYLVEWSILRLVDQLKGPGTLKFLVFIIFSLVAGRTLQRISSATYNQVK